MAGCCRGIPSNLPWAQNFGDGILRHPTQLYEMLAALSIFISLIVTYPRLRPHRGLIFFMAITLYSFVRFFNEFLRIDSPIIFGLFHLSNLAMIGILAIGLIGLYFVFQPAAQKEKVKAGFIRITTIFIVSLVISLSLGILILSFFRTPTPSPHF
jgi:prolipoprotein diacylglyceryltransferase